MGKRDESRNLHWIGRFCLATSVVGLGVSCTSMMGGGVQQPMMQQPGYGYPAQGAPVGGQVAQGQPPADYGWPPNAAGAQQQQNPYPVQPLGGAAAQGGYPSAPGFAPDYSSVVPPAPTQTQASVPASQQHTVKSGETLWSISRQYGTTVSALQTSNGLTGDVIQLGQVLNIP